ncbi:alpha/beta hydrolase [Pontiellaceae bacterium B12227]|nr:alpha/beta hydrolase [Pontiellaceae bacterium B12227]
MGILKWIAFTALALNSFGEGTPIESFDDWKPQGKPYEGWATSEVVPGATSCVVRANNFGGVYTHLGSLDVSAHDRMKLDAEVLDGEVGFVVVLEDADGTVNAYSWYNCYPGRQELIQYFNAPNKVQKEGGTPGLDLSKLTGLHIQVDDGHGSNNYAVAFNDLSAMGGVEPAAQKAAPAKLPTTYKTLRDIPYRGKDVTGYMQERCKLDVYYPESTEDFATVVWFHSGGLKRGNRYIPGELMNKGFAVVAVDYRLAPQAKAPEYIEDAAAAVAWVYQNIERVGGSPKKIVVAGASAGGYLSLMVGLDKQWLAVHSINADDLAGIVSLAGQAITHVAVREEQGIDRAKPVVNGLAPLNHVRGDAPPVLLVTGDRELELLGRYEENAYLLRMLKLNGHKNVELHELKGKDHGGVERPGLQYLLKFMLKVDRGMQ